MKNFKTYNISQNKCSCQKDLMKGNVTLKCSMMLNDVHYPNVGRFGAQSYMRNHLVIYPCAAYLFSPFPSAKIDGVFAGIWVERVLVGTC